MYLIIAVDVNLWLETDDVIEWLESYAQDRELTPPSTATPEDGRVFAVNPMYLTMFDTAIEMVEDRIAQNNTEED
jgi:hypothetical protein